MTDPTTTTKGAAPAPEPAPAGPAGPGTPGPVPPEGTPTTAEAARTSADTAPAPAPATPGGTPTTAEAAGPAAGTAQRLAGASGGREAVHEAAREAAHEAARDAAGPAGPGTPAPVARLGASAPVPAVPAVPAQTGGPATGTAGQADHAARPSAAREAAGEPAPRPQPPQKRRRRAGRGGGGLAVLPLLVFVAVSFGLPAIAILNGAFTVKDPATGATAYTTANLTASLEGAYFTALIGSVRLSATAAVIAAALGLVLAQAVLSSRIQSLRNAVFTASGVLANFGGVPLAFAFVATLGNAGVLTRQLSLTEHGWSLYSFWGLTLTYLYFLIPLMVLTITPALDGLRTQWREAAQNNGATGRQFWRYVALPVLAPSLLGGLVLLFGSSFAAHATAAAIVGSSVPLVTLQIADAISGNVLVGQENVALALSLDMVVIAGLVMAVYIPLQRRSARWLD